MVRSASAAMQCACMAGRTCGMQHARSRGQRVSSALQMVACTPAALALCVGGNAGCDALDEVRGQRLEGGSLRLGRRAGRHGCTAARIAAQVSVAMLSKHEGCSQSAPSAGSAGRTAAAHEAMFAPCASQCIRAEELGPAFYAERNPRSAPFLRPCLKTPCLFTL